MPYKKHITSKMGISQSFQTAFDLHPKSIMEFDRNAINIETAKSVFRQMAESHRIPSLEDFMWVLDEARKRFAELPNCVTVAPQPHDRLIFVGDMHGCFQTMMKFVLGDDSYEGLGFPGDIVDGKRNVFLINGDLVDRGGSAYQIVFSVCLFFLTTKDSIYVNRGNHETAMFGGSIMPGMGFKFMDEIKQKFPNVNLADLSKPINAFFCSLPICHLIDKEVFMVHGGVPDYGIEIDKPELMELSKFEQIRGSKLPAFKLEQLKELRPTRFETLDVEDHPVKQNVLWHSFLWSYDRSPLMARFMRENGIKTIVCSHTATPYHYITTFSETPTGFEVESIARGDEAFKNVKEFYDSHPHIIGSKVQSMEIFSSPTNQGHVYVAVVCADENGHIKSDTFSWSYEYLGNSTDFPFVDTAIQQ